ncbi:MAG TPA: glycerophosphodiester phosphodiesterase [Candidatus Brocadiia bacterium]|nr:glycerophosphodiester phosphodiesterase [Candidatus Brocadiia bacterium]
MKPHKRNALACLAPCLFLLTAFACAGERPQAQSAVAEKQDAARTVISRLRDPNAKIKWPSGHRGDRDAGPDNSVAAIESAAKAGCPLIEIDIRTNKSGSMFLFHDGEFNERNFSGPKEWIGRDTCSLTDAEMPQFCQPGHPGLRILSFKEALEIVKPYDTVLQLDLKNESPKQADACVAVARESGQSNQILIQCQLPSTLSHLRGKHPDIAVLSRCRSNMHVRMSFKYKPEIIQIDEDWATPELVREIHEHGSKILVKSMGADTDLPAHWDKLAERGLDILMTDHAAKMSAHMGLGKK